MRKRLTAEALENIERQVVARSNLKPRHVIGLVTPDGTHTHSITKINNEWVRTTDQPTFHLAAKLERAVTTDRRFVVIIGGRGSGKSTGVADICLMRMDDDGEKIMCFREFQESIDDSVHSMLKGEIERLGLSGFSSTLKEVVSDSGGRSRYKGMKANPQSIKSAHGFKTYWGEEAQTISAESLKALTPTARNTAKSGLPSELDEEGGAQIFFVANPRSAADPFSERFIIPFERELIKNGFYEDDLHTIIEMNYTDNPWFLASGLEAERAFDEANIPQAVYDHIWLGKHLDTIDGAIIDPLWFDAAIDSHIKLNIAPSGATYVSHDPSDLGADPKGYSVRKGIVFTDIGEFENVDAFIGARMACDKVGEHNADYFIWDGDGLGATLRDHIGQYLGAKRCERIMYRGSGAVANPEAIYKWDGKGAGAKNAKTNKDTFYNRRAQKCWELRDRFYYTWRAVTYGEYIDPDKLISLSSGIKNLQALKSEVCRIPQKIRTDGLLQVMSKPEMRAKKIPSPNMFDSMVMSYDITGIIAKKPTHRPLPVRRIK